MTMTEGTQQDPGTGQEVKRAGNAILGPEEPKEKTGPSISERVAEVRANLQAGKDPVTGMKPQEPVAPEPTAVAAADQPPADEPPADEPPADEPPALPDGFMWVGEEVRRADGTFPSVEELESINATLAGSAEGELAADAPPAPEAEAASDEVDEKAVVRLPGRGPDDPEEEWEIADPKLVNSLNRLRNGFMRGEELKREKTALAGQREEVDFVFDSLTGDPEGFVLEHVTDPEIRRGIARQLMADPNIFKSVMEEFGAIEDDEEALSAKRDRLRLEQLEKRDSARAKTEKTKALRTQVMAVRDTLDGFAESLDDSRRQTFQRYAARELADHIREKKIESIPVDEITVVLQQRGVLQLFGLTPGAPGTGNGSRTAGAGPTDDPPAPSAPAPAHAAAGGKKAVNARMVGEQLRAARETREAAAAVTPAGSGAVPTRIKPPDGQGVRDRISWFRKTRGLS
jgi:hypothetical protein